MRFCALITSIALCFGSSAQALSCMRPDAASLFHWAQESEEPFYAAVGQLDFAPPPKLSVPGAQEFSATLRGTSLTQSGFTAPIDTDVFVKTSCVGPWCGHVQSGEKMLMVLKRDNDQLILHVNACPNTTLSNPTAAQIQTFVNCTQGKTCQARR